MGAFVLPFCDRECQALIENRDTLRTRMFATETEVFESFMEVAIAGTINLAHRSTVDEVRDSPPNPADSLRNPHDPADSRRFPPNPRESFAKVSRDPRERFASRSRSSRTYLAAGRRRTRERRLGRFYSELGTRTPFANSSARSRIAGRLPSVSRRRANRTQKAQERLPAVDRECA